MSDYRDEGGLRSGLGRGKGRDEGWGREGGGMRVGEGWDRRIFIEMARGKSQTLVSIRPRSLCCTVFFIFLFSFDDHLPRAQGGPEGREGSQQQQGSEAST